MPDASDLALTPAMREPGSPYPSLLFHFKICCSRKIQSLWCHKKHGRLQLLFTQGR